MANAAPRGWRIQRRNRRSRWYLPEHASFSFQTHSTAGGLAIINGQLRCDPMARRVEPAGFSNRSQSPIARMKENSKFDTQCRGSHVRCSWAGFFHTPPLGHFMVLAASFIILNILNPRVARHPGRECLIWAVVVGLCYPLIESVDWTQRLRDENLDGQHSGWGIAGL